MWNDTKKKKVERNFNFFFAKLCFLVLTLLLQKYHIKNVALSRNETWNDYFKENAERQSGGLGTNPSAPKEKARADQVGESIFNSGNIFLEVAKEENRFLCGWNSLLFQDLKKTRTDSHSKMCSHTYIAN